MGFAKNQSIETSRSLSRLASRPICVRVKIRAGALFPFSDPVRRIGPFNFFRRCVTARERFVGWGTLFRVGLFVCLFVLSLFFLSRAADGEGEEATVVNKG